MDQPVLAARVRLNKGKGAVRKLRRKNQIPAIFYGPETKPIMLALDYPELESLTKQGTGENIILDLQVRSEQGTETRKAMLKDIMIDPIKDTYLHVDFYEISMDKEITVDIPLHLLNVPAGVVKGGILQHIRRELTVCCLPGMLTDSIDVDVSGMEVGDSLHISDIEFPEGMTTTDEGHLTVAVVAAPTIKEKEAEDLEIEVEEEPAQKGAENVEKTDHERGGE
ncbi:MAG: 50S ribosomal protein L25 [Thermodesulfobacteriota bacterium]|nr:50S ribosomal protein L25 [Thermodesulfobacteriota bacterium]